MIGFDEGYRFFAQNAGIQFAGYGADRYVNSVKTEIDKLLFNLNAFEGYLTDPNMLKGDIAEFWHQGTFNANAAARDSASRVFADRSHDFASADICSNFGKMFGLKYYGNAVESAKQQSKSIFERFGEYRANGGKDTLEKFLYDRQFSDVSVLNDPIYTGQVRIIPKDQLSEACEWLKRKIATEAANRPEQVLRYQETFDMLSDRLQDNNGTESIALSEADAKVLAELAKKGNVTAEELAKFGVSTEELINFENITKQAFKAGLSAAVVSVVLKVAPEIYHALVYLVENGELEEEEFQRIGFTALQGGSEGFIRGSISAAITASCEAGLLGEAFKEVTPEAIGMVVVLTMNTMKNAFKVATGEMTRNEMADQLMKEMVISAFSYSFGAVAQSVIGIPVLGFMLGSFVGSVVGAFTYNVGYTAVLSFCIDTGFTMFGLVDQNYAIPKEILVEIGIEVFDYETFEVDGFEPDTFELESFSVESFEPDTLDIIFLRRGVIGVSQVGYTY